MLNSCRDLALDESNFNINEEPTALTEINLGTEKTCVAYTWPLWYYDFNGASSYGSLSASNDKENLYVTYTAPYNACFKILRLWVGTDLATLPKDKVGNPALIKFPYVKEVYVKSLENYTFTIPLSSIPDYKDCKSSDYIYIVGYAEAQINCDYNTTVGVFGGKNFVPSPDIKGHGWYYADYKVECCNGNIHKHPSEIGSAFAKGQWVFASNKEQANPEALASLLLTENQWGWAIQMPYKIDKKAFDLWANAGLNDISKGVLVGQVYVSYDAKIGRVVVTYVLKEGYFMKEAQLYISDTRPTTTAPGQYGHTFEFKPMVNKYEYIIDKFFYKDFDSDGFWVIAHAVVYGSK